MSVNSFGRLTQWAFYWRKFSTQKTEERQRRTRLFYKDHPHKTTWGPSAMSEIVWLCAAQTEQRMLADRKLILFLCLSDQNNQDFVWLQCGLHTDAFLCSHGYCRCTKNSFSWYCQTLAALQRNNICCIFSDTTTSNREGPVEFCNNLNSKFGYLHI